LSFSYVSFLSSIPPSPPSTLFPYTTLFRSCIELKIDAVFLHFLVKHCSDVRLDMTVYIFISVDDGYTDISHPPILGHFHTDEAGTDGNSVLDFIFVTSLDDSAPIFYFMTLQ